MIMMLKGDSEDGKLVEEYTDRKMGLFPVFTDKDA